MDPTIRYISATNDSIALDVDSRLWSIVVGTATATSVITVYNGTSTSGEVKALINGATVGNYDFAGARFPAGLFIKMTTAGAKVSVVAG